MYIWTEEFKCSCESTLKISSLHSDPSTNAVVGGMDNGVLRKTALNQLLMGKKAYVNTDVFGALPPIRLQYTHFLEVKLYTLFG